jgi:hypothetical protein
LEDFLTFRRYITPPLIMLIYTIGAFSITGLAFLFIYLGAQPCSFGICLGNLYVILGIITLIFGNLAWRLLCEYLVVQFRIYDALRSIDSKFDLLGVTRTAPPAQTPAVPVTHTSLLRRCPYCGSENGSAAKFCRSCARELEPERTETKPSAPPRPTLIICDQCGAKNDPRNKYCDMCGVKFT